MLTINIRKSPEGSAEQIGAVNTKKLIMWIVINDGGQGFIQPHQFLTIASQDLTSLGWLGWGIGQDYCLHCLSYLLQPCIALLQKQNLHYLPCSNCIAPALQVLPYFACQCQCLESQPVRQKLLFQGDRVNIMQSSCYLCSYSSPQIEVHYNCRSPNSWSFYQSWYPLSLISL